MKILWKNATILFPALLMLLAAGPFVFGAQVPPPIHNVTLGWSASADPNVMGYHVWYGTNSGNLINMADVGTNTTFTLSGLVPGTTYYFSTSSYNSADVDSAQTAQTAYVAPGVLALTGFSATNAAIVIQFPVAPSTSYQLQASSDLKTWSNIWTFAGQSTNGWVQYSDPFASKTGHRFYRLVMP